MLRTSIIMGENVFKRACAWQRQQKNARSGSALAISASRWRSGGNEWRRLPESSVAYRCSSGCLPHICIGRVVPVDRCAYREGDQIDAGCVQTSGKTYHLFSAARLLANACVIRAAWTSAVAARMAQRAVVRAGAGGPGARSNYSFIMCRMAYGAPFYERYERRASGSAGAPAKRVCVAWKLRLSGRRGMRAEVGQRERGGHRRAASKEDAGWKSWHNIMALTIYISNLAIWHGNSK